MSKSELHQTAAILLPPEGGGRGERYVAATHWWSRLLWGLRAKNIATFLIPALLTVGLFAWFARFRLRESLDVELGLRLISVARAAVPLLPSDQIDSFAPGDEKIRSYRNLQRKLRRLKKATGVRRIYVFDRDRKSLLDTKATPVGQKYVSLSFEASELKAVFSGRPKAGVLFQDKQGRQYKTGFTPLLEGKDVLAVVAVEGSALYFQQIRDLQRELFFVGLLSILLVVLTGFLFTGWLVAPVKKLVSAANRMGEGNLTESVPTLGQDEIGSLAETMEEMRLNILARDRQMQMMLSGIAHEVRNPLGGMELFSGILKEELAGDPEKLSYVDRIQRELRYLGEVVNSFLNFARPSTIHITKQDWHEFLIEIQMLLSPAMQEKDVSIELLGLPLEREISFDRSKIHQAVLNLVQNAIQASPKGGMVRLESSLEESGLLFTIQDKGTGIPEEKLEQVFEPFFTTKEKGTGLGLPLAKKFVEVHAGRIAVACPLEGGTVVSLWLPQGDFAQGDFAQEE